MPPSSIVFRRRSSCLASFGWTVKPSGTREELLVQPAQPVGRDGRDDDLGAVARRGRLVRAARDRIAEGRLQPLVRLAQLRRRLGERAVGLLRGDDALGDERCGVQLAHGRVLLDLLTMQRLRVRGLVLLVVAEAPVADEVDDDVVAEPAAVGDREPDGGDAASGSSALTWMIGTSKPLARSLE